MYIYVYIYSSVFRILKRGGQKHFYFNLKTTKII